MSAGHPFPGPRGEQLEDLAVHARRIVEDNREWRRRLHPVDPGAGADGTLPDSFAPALAEMTSRLQESFPFHSPRYLAHQQNEVQNASVLGVLAGTLYNANNITTNSGFSTVGLEIDACRDVVRMLGGFKLPPEDGVSSGVTFSWSHLTSGGTVANVEALWVARKVAYLPFLVRAACRQHKIHLPVQVLSRGRSLVAPIADVEPAILRMSHEPALRLLDDLTRAVYADLLSRPYRPGEQIDARLLARARVRVRDMLTEAEAEGGYAAVASVIPPVVFAPATAHYSIVKAADTLGIGRSNLVLVEVDAHFRMSTDALELAVVNAIDRGELPVAVVGVLGTTEEGSVDPIAEIAALRSRLEATQAHSFWIHVDAAWGGYFAAALRPKPTGPSREVVRAAAAEHGGPPAATALDEWFESYLNGVQDAAAPGSPLWLRVAAVRKPTTSQRDADRELRSIADLPGGMRPPTRVERLEQLTIDVSAFPGDLVDARSSTNVEPVLRAVDALGSVQSLTIDPHKMGHAAYPAGMVVFQDDRVRDLVAHDAPYVNKDRGFDSFERPPLRTERGTGSPSKWTLEGSRPSSAACSVWLSHRTVPLHREAHGAVMIRSLQAARYFDALLRDRSWWPTLKPGGDDVQLIPLAPDGPDTNIVLFCVVPVETEYRDLATINVLTAHVRDSHGVDIENGGDPQAVGLLEGYLSGHELAAPTYSMFSMTPVLHRLGVRDVDSYPERGLTVARAVLANPYWWELLEEHGHDALRESVTRIITVARTWSSTPAPR